jgi:hypothetical protein
MRETCTAVVAITLLLSAAPAFAGDVTLAWDPNTESDLAGYKVYFGTAPGTYGTPITLGTQTTYTVTGLPPGTWYFAVTAYNTSGLESAYSNEVSTVVTATSTGSACDINGDSAPNALDVQTLVNIVLGTRTCPGSCDVNKDGRVDAIDLQVLVNVVLGVRVCP